jgi:hypothetical protein
MNMHLVVFMGCMVQITADRLNNFQHIFFVVTNYKLRHILWYFHVGVHVCVCVCVCLSFELERVKIKVLFIRTLGAR